MVAQGLVVDASVIVAALAGTSPARGWARDQLQSGPGVAPELVHFEAANALRRLEMAGQISNTQAAAAFKNLMIWRVQLWPFGPLAERMWELRHAVTAYDAAYVALAEQLDLPLATMDVRMATAPGPRCRFVTPESGLPDA